MIAAVIGDGSGAWITAALIILTPVALIVAGLLLNLLLDVVVPPDPDEQSIAEHTAWDAVLREGNRR